MKVVAFLGTAQPVRAHWVAVEWKGDCAAEPGAGTALALHLCPCCSPAAFGLAFQGLVFSLHICSIPGPSCAGVWRCGCSISAALPPEPALRPLLVVVLATMARSHCAAGTPQSPPGLSLMK